MAWGEIMRLFTRNESKPERVQPAVSCRGLLVVTDNYIWQAHLWLEVFHASNADIPVTINALDRATFDAASSLVEELGHPCTVTLHQRDPTRSFWSQRLSLWREALLKEKEDVLLVSDCDNFVVGSIGPLALLCHGDHSAVVQPATGMPLASIERWGFSLCCGMAILSRPRLADSSFMTLWERETANCHDDQLGLNEILSDARWQPKPARQLIMGSLELDGHYFAVPSFLVSSRSPLYSCPMGPGTIFWHPNLNKAPRTIQEARELSGAPLRMLRAFLLESIGKVERPLSYFGLA